MSWKGNFKCQLHTSYNSLAVEAAHDMILISDRGGKILYLNQAFVRCTGYSIEEAIGSSTNLLKSGKHDKVFYDDLWATISSGQVWSGSLINRRKDGSFYEEEQTVTPIIDADGEVCNYIAIKRDVSELASIREKLRATEGELRLRNQQFEFLFSNIDDFVYMHDSDGVFTYITPSVERITGYSVLEWMQHYRTFMLDSEINAKVEEITAHLLLTGETTPPYLVEIRHRDGSVLTLELTECLDKSDGSNKGVIGVARNVTQRIQAEKRLRQVEKLEALGGLAAGIAHEINSPMQYIGDNLSYLHKSFGKLEKYIETLESVIQQVDQNSGLLSPLEEATKELGIEKVLTQVPSAIDDCLDGVSRVSSIIQSIRYASYPDNSTVVETSISEAFNSASTLTKNNWKHCATLSVECPDSLPQIQCPPGFFNQVLVNLINNAVDAINEIRSDKPGSMGEILLSAKADGEYALIQVSDSGCGMPEQVRERIFEPFYTTKGVGKGTGQGLYKAYSLVVDRFGGSIEVESELLVGTTFSLRIPFVS